MKKLFLVSTVFLCMTLAHGQQSKIDSLLTVFKTAKEDTNKVNLASTIMKEYFYSNNIEKALEFAKDGKALSEKINFQKGIAIFLNSLGNIYIQKGDFTEALHDFQEALKLNRVSQNLQYQATNCNNIGETYRRLGDYSKSLEYHFMSLKLKEKIGFKQEIPTSLTNIGIVYDKMGDQSHALEYYNKALKMEQDLGKTDLVAANYHNIGTIYEDQKDYNRALEYYLNALKINEKNENNYFIIRNLSGIGNTYGYQANYSKAIEYYEKSLAVAEQIDDKDGIAFIYSNIGELYKRQGKTKDAKLYLNKALNLANQVGDKDIIKEIYLALSEVDSMDMNYSSAYQHYKMHSTYKDSLINEENIKNLTQKEMQYDFDKKESLAKAEQDKKDAIAQEEKQKQKVITYSISGGLFLVLLLALFIFRGYRQKQKANKELADKNILIEKSKHIIEEKNKDITDSINYARRIQKAMLPHRKDIWTAFPQSFVLYKPKDIVSGDFYFFHKNGQTAFIASADCTGHGVPGAFMSMIGAGKLNDAVAQSTDTSVILSLLNKGVKSALKQSETDETATRDGMDIALCSVDSNARIVKYAGANRPIWIIRNGSTAIEEIKATKKAIGGFTEDSQHFDSHEIKLEPGDTFYLHTDGFADTFGGNEAKKVTTKRFKEILVSIQDKTMKEQEHHLDSFIEKWKGGTEQIDDILVIGVRL